MTGFVLTLAFVGVVATGMIVGIRMKLPPPDPDWREHLPTPLPSRSRFWLRFWLARYPFLLAAVVVAAFRPRLALCLYLIFVAMIFTSTTERFAAAKRSRRVQRPS